MEEKKEQGKAVKVASDALAVVIIVVMCSIAVAAGIKAITFMFGL